MRCAVLNPRRSTPKSAPSDNTRPCEIVDGASLASATDRTTLGLCPNSPLKARLKLEASARYHIGADPIDTASIALIVKNRTSLVGFDATAFAGHSLRRGAISSGVAAGVHIARLKQFSGHTSLKSLEEYVELDELRHNHPLKDIL
jgi:hypothetical protein